MTTTYRFDESISSAVDTPQPRLAADDHETAVAGPLSPELLRQMGRYWAAAAQAARLGLTGDLTSA